MRPKNPKNKDEKELWDIRQETGENPEDMSPEDQLEYFRRGAEESIGSLGRKRSRRGRHEIPRIPAKGTDLPPDETTE